MPYGELLLFYSFDWQVIVRIFAQLSLYNNFWMTSAMLHALHNYILSFFFLMIRRPPISTLLPYTTLFRSLLAEPLRSPGLILLGECRGQRPADPFLDRSDHLIESFPHGVVAAMEKVVGRALPAAFAEQ